MDVERRAIATLLGDVPALLRARGYPLESGLRAFLESRFGQDLSRVRIHEGAWADAACKALNASAFVWQTNIVFSAGQYAPETPLGRRLLAHELVHVLQQTLGRTTAACDRPSGVGLPDDPREAEAHLVAEQVLRLGPVASMTPDLSGVLRRAINLDANSARMSVSSSGAVAKVTVGTKRAACHLTTGFSSADTKPVATGDAFTFTGEVDVFVDKSAEVDILRDKWTFNFIQIAKVIKIETQWLGRRSSEGEVFHILHIGPAWPANQLTSLDAEPASSPFMKPGTHSANRFRPKDGKIKVELRIQVGDHPNSVAVLQAPNTITKSNNFLFKMERVTEFVTVLMARDEKGVLLSPLAHIPWRIEYDARFKWARNQARGELKSRGAIFSPVVKGGPQAADVKRILANPQPPHTNEISERALKNSINILNKQDSATRSLLVPRDFFL